MAPATSGFHHGFQAFAVDFSTQVEPIPALLTGADNGILRQLLALTHGKPRVAVEVHQLPNLENHCTLGTRINSGTSALIYSGHMKGSNVPVAIKVFDPHLMETRPIAWHCRQDDVSTRLRLFHREFTALSSLNNEGVPSAPTVFGLCKHEISPGLWVPAIVMGFLDKFPKKLTPDLLLSIVRAVAALHERGLIHGDLKEDHLMMRPQSKQVVLVDHGLQGESCIGRGTPDYIPLAEMFECSMARDVYSLGVCIYKLIFNVLPFEAFSLEQRLYHEPPHLDLFSRYSRLNSFVATMIADMMSAPLDRRPQNAMIVEHRLRKALVELANSSS